MPSSRYFTPFIFILARPGPLAYIAHDALPSWMLHSENEFLLIICFHIQLKDRNGSR